MISVILAGGSVMTFSGLAIYDSGVFNTIAEDVSDEISLISPFETPLLDVLSQAPRAAANVLHEWLEEELGPNTISVSLTATDAEVYIVPHKAGTLSYPFLQVGMVLENQSTGEMMQVGAVAVNTVTVSRGFAGTSADTLTAGNALFMVADAALEGADVSGDITVPRSRKTNYCQIFKKDVIVSGTMQAVNKLGGIGDEYEHQKMQRLREAVRDLEKATIRGKLSGNTIGGSAVANTRTMKGLWATISTNASSVSSLDQPRLDDAIKLAWDSGGETDLIVVDANWKRVIDGWNDSRTEVMQGGGQDERYHRRITFYEGTFGSHQVVLDRWMPAYSLMVLDRNRCHVVPLQGRSFRHETVSKTGDSQKGMVLGEYTVEAKNEEGMSKVYGPS
jgi:hypothetical protein